MATGMATSAASKTAASPGLSGAPVVVPSGGPERYTIEVETAP